MKRSLLLCLVLPAGIGAVRAAPPAGDASVFLEGKKNVIAVAIERVRQAPDDAQRALKAGEEGLRRLHEDYKVARSTPPTSLKNDVREMTSAANRVRLERSHGRTPAPDPRAQEVVRRHWEKYRDKVWSLMEDVRYKKDAGASEAAVYWQALKDQETLAAELSQALAYNTPPGERSIEEAAAKDRWELLKRLEDPARVRGRLACVKAPQETALSVPFDIGPFYRAAGLLPGLNPLNKGAFLVPPGCRTVTQRESGVKLILRSAKGRGTIIIGAEERPLAYDYVVVPPEVPYIVENGGPEPLDVEFISLFP